MTSDRVQKRLEELNRATAQVATPRVVVTQNPFDDSAPLPGSEVMTEWGPHWLLRQPIQSVWPASDRYLSAVFPVPELAPKVAADSRPTHDSFEDDAEALRASHPRRAVYLDLETCGFAGSMVFLVGLLHWHHEQLTLSQLLARNYAEEKAIFQSLWSLMVDTDVLITFNGKSFDWPQVHDRSTLHHLGHRATPDDLDPSNANSNRPQQQRLPLPRTSLGMELADRRPEPWHVDLLHHARRRWRHELPNCRLQTLERYLCGRNRVGDLPGREIPSAYHNYVRSEDTCQVHAILHHNALDLVTLLQLALLVMEPVRDR